MELHNLKPAEGSTKIEKELAVVKAQKEEGLLQEVILELNLDLVIHEK